MFEANKKQEVESTSIKHKLVRTGGKIILSGVLISSTLLLSGCTSDENKTFTAIFITNDNALLIDVDEYQYYRSGEVAMYDMNGNKITIDSENVIIIKGENSHEKAQQIAEDLIGEKGEIVDYNEEQGYSKTI